MPIAVAALSSFFIGLICGLKFSDINYLEVVLTSLSQMEIRDWQSASSIIYGALGLILGYLFFHKRVIIDNQNHEHDRIRSRLSYIYEEFKRVDDLANQIFSREAKDDIKLCEVRSKLDKTLILMNEFLDNNDKLMKFNSDELESILKVHSVISNSNVISEVNHRVLEEADITEERLLFSDAIQEARTICLQKMESF